MRLLLLMSIALCCSAAGISTICRANPIKWAEKGAEVRLGHGRIGDFRWAVFAGLADPSRGSQRVCLTASSGISRAADAGSGFALCGSVDGDAQVLVAKSEGIGKRTRTVLGMAFSNSVRSVRLWLRGRTSRRVWLKRLDRKRAVSSGLSRFRYATRAFAGPFCLKRFAAYDASGDLLRITPTMSCPK
jgi:hypothetical protein